MEENIGFYKHLIDNVSDGVYFVDLERRITFWNKAAEILTGYRSSEVLGKNCGDNILMHIDEKGKRLCECACPLTKTMKEGKPCEEDVFLHHKDGHRSPVHIKATPMRNAKEEITGAVEVFSDTTSIISMSQKMEELQRMAMFDILTDVENRRFAEIELTSRLSEMQRFGWPFGILFIDIDHFKNINDRYGHDTGDRVLMMIAKTLAKSLRPFDFVSRWGGEEFIVGVVNVNEEQLSNIADKLRHLVEQSSLTVGEDIISVTVSIGAAIATPDDTKDTLIKRADKLMYLSKKSGRNRVSI